MSFRPTVAIFDSFWTTVAYLGGGVLTLLGLITVMSYMLYQFSPSIQLLVRSRPSATPYYSAARAYITAILTLFRLLLRGFQAGSLRKAVRLRIELEILKPPPDRPLRLDYDTGRGRKASNKKYRTALQKYRQDKKEWLEEIWTDLRTLARAEESARSIEIDNLTPLIDSDRIKSYFNALYTERLSAGEAPCFISRVTVRSGFITPLHLLTGVLKRYDEDWQRAIDDYGRAMIIEDDELRGNTARKIQLFIFDCWLLWGPSISLCTCTPWRGEKALQFGSGDEDNSLSVMCSAAEISSALGAATPPEAFAWQARVTGRLRWGAALHQADICPAQEAVWRDRRIVLDAAGETPAIKIGRGNNNAQASATYYSAYIWIMFAMCTDRDGTLRANHPDEKWMDLVPFFAHANIADRDSYDFQINNLAQNAVHGAMQILEMNTALHLRFVGAIDETGCGHDPIHKDPKNAPTIRAKMNIIRQQIIESSAGSSTLERLTLTYERDNLFMKGDYSTCKLPKIIRKYYESADKRAQDQGTGSE
ncbi:hypothetical protein ABZ942_22145 [Nocardia sp. NPDC046473]|uniref:hypothetical protein n=1 Tax=Nocardia sp. NPDC046473 TaxID=3155733 RepID=UPI0034119792